MVPVSGRELGWARGSQREGSQVFFKGVKFAAEEKEGVCGSTGELVQAEAQRLKGAKRGSWL